MCFCFSNNIIQINNLYYSVLFCLFFSINLANLRYQTDLYSLSFLAEYTSFHTIPWPLDGSIVFVYFGVAALCLDITIRI